MNPFQYKPRRGIAAFIATMTLMCLSVPIAAQEYRLGEIEVLHPFAPPTPPGVSMAAGYLDIINHGDKADRLTGGSVFFAHELQIHETTVDGDVSRMRQLVDGIVIPAGGTVRLEPMGKHLMFIKLAEPLVDGDRQSGTLTFEHAGDMTVEFAIEHAAADTMSHEGMNHGQMDHGNMMRDEMTSGDQHGQVGNL